MIGNTFGVSIKNFKIYILKVIDIIFDLTNCKIDCYDYIALIMISIWVSCMFNKIGIVWLIDNALDDQTEYYR